MIEHIGSTSVPCLVAKPVIDIALRLPDDCRIADAAEPLERAGWTEPTMVGDHWATYLMNNGVRRAIEGLFTAEQAGFVLEMVNRARTALGLPALSGPL